MKSRLLSSTTVILFLLLGLLTTSSFAQITNTTTVGFKLKNPQTTAYRSLTSTTEAEDTVGRKANWQVSWEAGSQSLDVTTYTITFPKGTVVDLDTLKANGIQMEYLQAGYPPTSTITNYIPTANISMGATNPRSSADPTKTPSVIIVAHRSFTNYGKYTLSFLSGVWHSKKTTGTNLWNASSLRPKMKITFVDSDSPTNTFLDSTNFYVSNDDADSVLFNNTIQSVVSGSYWSGGDTLVILDRFGNYVPDFFNTANDSILISVQGGSDVGTFSSRLADWRDATAAWGVLVPEAMFDTLGAGDIVRIQNSASIAFFSAVTGLGYAALDSTPGGSWSGDFFQGVQRSTGTDAQKNKDLWQVPLYLGNTVTSGHAATFPWTFGLKFNNVGKVTGDTVTFIVNIGSRTSTRKASGTVLGVPANKTTVIKRVLMPGAAVTKIGTVALSFDKEIAASTDRQTYYNALPLTSSGGSTFTVTVKDLFGDVFGTTQIGSASCDTVILEWHYIDIAWNEDDNSIGEATWSLSSKNSMLASGGTVNSRYTRPAAKLFKTGIFSGNSIIANSSNKTDAAGALDISAAVYVGTTAEKVGEGIRLVAYAKNNTAARDSVLIAVQPSPPVAWDLDDFTANLATFTPVQNAYLPIEMPIFALDTAYNRISNMDLGNGQGYLGYIAHTGYATLAANQKLVGINFLIDGRDPMGYQHADSIQIADGGTRPKVPLATGTAGDDISFIYDYTTERADSSRLNLGEDGDEPMSFKVLYTGTNRRISLKWTPGDLNNVYSSISSFGGGGTGNVRSIDLGLFNLQSETAIDSVTTITGRNRPAGAVTYQQVQFTLNSGNPMGPNQADSLVFIKFLNLPTGAGLKSAMTTSDVSVSVDNVNFYNALAVGNTVDSIGLLVPMYIDAASSTAIVYVKLQGFTYPTSSDTTYGVKVATESSPVWATKWNAYTVTDSIYGSIKIAGSAQSLSNIPRITSRVKAPSLTLKAGVDSLFKIVLGDKYGNVIADQSALSALIIKSGGATTTSMNLTVKQTFAGTAATSRGSVMYDTLHISIDSTSSGVYSFIDSVTVTPAMSGSYYLVFMDSANIAIKDSILVTVKPTTADSLLITKAFGPDTLTRGSRSTALPYPFTVTLLDNMGNALSDSVVTFRVVYPTGATDKGSLIDSNGVTLATAVDSLAVKTDANGRAKSTLKTGALDSNAVKVFVLGRSDIGTRYFSALGRVQLKGASTINFKTVPDSIVPDTTNKVSVVVNALDGDLLKKAYLITYKTKINLDATTHKFSLAATTDTATVDSTVKAAPYPDSLNFSGSTAVSKLGYKVNYAIKVIDANDSTTWSAVKSYIVAPKRGKQSLGTAATNVADLMRTVYLVLGAVTAPTTIDYFGLDLDQSGDFNTPDLVGVLNIWKGTGTLLAGATKEENRTAKVELGYKEIDKANATLSINLANSGSLNLGIFKIKYDQAKFVLGKAVATNRLGEGMELVFHNNESEGTYGVVVLNVNGRPISSGNGAILTIPVTAKGEKFDGTGDISLLSVGFEQDVQTEVNKEALSPKAVLPKAFAMSQNFPNPFNPSTTIAFDIPEGQKVHVTLNVYNMRGQLVRSLVNEVRNEGSYQIQWDGMDNNGGKVSSGVYFYRIKAGDFSNTRKMVILK